jgi:hypothetical protein
MASAAIHRECDQGQAPPQATEEGSTQNGRSKYSSNVEELTVARCEKA